MLSYLENLFYAVALERLAERLQHDGYHVLLFLNRDPNVDKLVGEILQYHVDGIVLAAATLSSNLARQCADASIPVVLFNGPQGQVFNFKPGHRVRSLILSPPLLSAIYRLMQATGTPWGHWGHGVRSLILSPLLASAIYRLGVRSPVYRINRPIKIRPQGPSRYSYWKLPSHKSSAHAGLTPLHRAGSFRRAAWGMWPAASSCRLVQVLCFAKRPLQRPCNRIKMWMHLTHGDLGRVKATDQRQAICA